MGDFGSTSGSNRPTVIDRDNFEHVLERMAVALELPGAGTLRIKEMDDFHPDRLFSSLQIFQGLRDVRAQIADPRSFERTASELMTTARSSEKPAPPQDFLSSGSLLEQVVERSQEGPAAATARGLDPFQQYLRAIVAPYLVPRPDPKQGEMLAQVDNATAAQMRALLHYKPFQSLEAAWTSLYFLVRLIETDTDLKIYVWHMPKKTLASDLLPATDLKSTTLYRVLVKETVSTPGAHPWAVVAGNYSFGPGAQDVEMLGRFALLAGAANTPLIARADASLLGDDLTAWSELRAIAEAKYIGLALPGFLLRLPYGKESSPTDTFHFEEMADEPKHSDYLWGNPSIACAALMAQAFTRGGWEMQPGDLLDMSGLPAHVYKKDGEAVMKPCAEVLMTQEEAEALMALGLMPLLSMKNSDRVHLAGFRAINGEPLAGRWD